MIEVRSGWAYIRCRCPTQHFLAARSEMIAILECYDLEPGLVVMDGAPRTLREDEHWHFSRARNDWAISQLALLDWHRRTMENTEGLALDDVDAWLPEHGLSANSIGKSRNKSNNNNTSKSKHHQRHCR